MAGLILALIIGRFVVGGLAKVLFNQISSDGDESAYLALGLTLREEGVLSDGTRPPLYSALLTPVAEREWAYFTSAKLITLGLGVLTILATFGVGVRLFGWPAALLAAFLLGVNKEFHARSSTVYADVLLAVVLVGAWYYLIKSVEGWKNSLVAGVFVGLSFLTKGSAPVLLAAWGLLALVHYRFRVLRQFHLLLVPLFFVMVSLPLLIYNANTFGSPTYNFATQHIMWMDQLEQINTAYPADLPTAATYFATHTPAQMVERIQEGLARLNPVISRSLIPSRSFAPAWLGPLLGLLAAAILIFLLLFQRDGLRHYLTRRKNPLLFTLFLYGLFYPFFIWYVAGSSAETRFIIPLLAPLYLLLADAVVTLTQNLGKTLTTLKIDYQFLKKKSLLTCHFEEERREISMESVGISPRFAGRNDMANTPNPLITIYRLALIAVVAWGVWWLLVTTWADRWVLAVDPYESDRQANLQEEEMVQWLSRDNPAAEVLVTFGPSKSLPLWKFPPRFTLERLPVEVNTWAAMESYIQTQQPAYIILDEDTVRRRRQALSAYFQYQPDPALVSFEKIPPGWALAFVYPEIPCRWCIFSPTTLRTANPIATFTNGIQLLDWRINHPITSQAFSGEIPLNNQLRITNYELPPATLHLTLTWRTQNPLPTAYTIFAHLTVPDGFVKAQSDRQPLAGAWPTSRWQPGELLADRYDLALDASVTPGEYLLLAGLYDPDNGERLPLLEGPPGPAPATVLLGTVVIE